MDEKVKSFRDTLVYLVGWVLACILAILDLFFVRELLRDVMTWIQVAVEKAQTARGELHSQKLGWTIETIDRGMLFLGGITAVALVIWIEYYLRNAEKKGKLFPSLFKVLGIEAAIILVSWVLTLLI